MNWEKSCGAVVFTRRDKEILFVIVEEQAGSYSFPKGHMEANEAELETARREIWEETGLRPEFLNGFYQQEEYHLAEKPGTWKQVVYFLAEFKDEPLIPQEGEIKKVHLLPYEQAYRLIPHENTRRILTAAYAFLTK